MLNDEKKLENIKTNEWKIIPVNNVIWGGVQ